MTKAKQTAKGKTASDKFVVAQKPNTPQIIAVVAIIIFFFTSGWLADLAFSVFVASLSYWSYLEIAKGANWLRRVFGIIGLAVVVISLVAKLS